jgi:hypothetical protein
MLPRAEPRETTSEGETTTNLGKDTVWQGLDSWDDAGRQEWVSATNTDSWKWGEDTSCCTWVCP